ncbi:hypothetical protein [Ferrovibrio sp.]|uniref:hypothetical protein n=1 Tax=Ferrovibrio sp. TaxID=1917215 RepID=UPI00262E95AF|nr:hypothetical protein [Ferrovibrio sp.]
MKRFPFSAALGGAVLAVLLAGCSGTASEPYYLGRFTPEDVGKYERGESQVANDPQTGRPYFSVCYNSALHSAEQVRALVRKHCADPQLWRNRTDLYSCSLAAPARATYSCSALSRTAEEARPNLLRSESYTGAINLY